MTTSAEMAEFALWMMVGGGIVFVFGVAAHFLSGVALDRGTLVKPLTIVGLAICLIGAFLRYSMGYF